MIYFRCEHCAGVMRADEAQAGTLVSCGQCGTRHVCPAATVARTDSQPPGGGNATPPGSPAHWRTVFTPARVLGGVLLLLTLSWGAAAMAGWTTGGRIGETAANESAADRRQREILQSALGNAADPLLGLLFTQINSRHFQDELPAIPVLWEPRLAEVGELAADAFTLEGMFGHVDGRSIILLNPGLSRDSEALRRALAHEMVHAWLHTVGESSSSSDHGPAFQAVLRRLAEEGAFEALPATTADRRELRQWLEEESTRLEAEAGHTRRESEWLAREAAGLEAALAGITGAGPAADGGSGEAVIAAWNRRRQAYDDRVTAYRARVARHRAELDAFNAQVDRYNLMLAYPDGLDAAEPLAGPR